MMPTSIGEDNLLYWVHQFKCWSHLEMPSQIHPEIMCNLSMPWTVKLTHKINHHSKYWLIVTISDTIIAVISLEICDLYALVSVICHFQMFYIRHSYFRSSLARPAFHVDVSVLLAVGKLGISSKLIELYFKVMCGCTESYASVVSTVENCVWETQLKLSIQ